MIVQSNQNQIKRKQFRKCHHNTLMTFIMSQDSMCGIWSYS